MSENLVKEWFNNLNKKRHEKAFVKILQDAEHIVNSDYVENSNNEETGMLIACNIPECNITNKRLNKYFVL